MPRIWDHYEFKIAGHYLPALINADTTGMEDDEETQFNEWEKSVRAGAKAAGFSIGHWDCDNEESDDWGTCAVSGLLAMRQTVRLMVYKDEA